MHSAYQPVVEVLGDTLALMTRRERGVWSLHDANTDILAVPNGRFKILPHINHSSSHGGLSVRSLMGILAEAGFDDLSNGKETLMRATCRRQVGSCTRQSDPPTHFAVVVQRGIIVRQQRSLCWVMPRATGNQRWGLIRLPSVRHEVIANLRAAGSNPIAIRNRSAGTQCQSQSIGTKTTNRLTRSACSKPLAIRVRGRRDWNPRPHGPTPNDRSGTAVRSSRKARLPDAETPRRHEMGADQA